MRRLPFLPTLLVGLAVAAMIALGLWQLLDRRPRKLAFLEQLAANPARPPVAFPRIPDERLLFRRASAVCAPPVSIRLAGAGAAATRSSSGAADAVARADGGGAGTAIVRTSGAGAARRVSIATLRTRGSSARNSCTSRSA